MHLTDQIRDILTPLSLNTIIEIHDAGVDEFKYTCIGNGFICNATNRIKTIDEMVSILLNVARYPEAKIYRKSESFAQAWSCPNGQLQELDLGPGHYIDHDFVTPEKNEYMLVNKNENIYIMGDDSLSVNFNYNEISNNYARLSLRDNKDADMLIEACRLMINNRISVLNIK